MIASPKPNATLAELKGPTIETPRLILRQWRPADIAPYTAMLADPGTARFITVDGQPVADEMTGWRHTVVMAGHWAIHGAGMFAVEEKHSGKFVGRVGHGFRRPGRTLRSAGASQKMHRAKAMRVKPRARRSTGRSRVSTSRRWSIASIAKTPRHRVWRGGLALRRTRKSSYSAMSRICGSRDAMHGRHRGIRTSGSR